MDTGWKNWALTIGTAVAASLIATGHGQIVVGPLARAITMAWSLVHPLGPA